MKLKIKIFKFALFFLIILNLSILISGHYYYDSKLEYKKEVLNKDLEIYIRKKESLIEELSIIESSKEDIFSNLKQLKENITLLKSQLGTLQNNVSLSEEDIYSYQDKLIELNTKKNELEQTKISLQNQIIKREQQTSTKTTTKTSISNTNTKTITTPVIKKPVTTKTS